jgi:DNA-binding response OmpR family regulator
MPGMDGVQLVQAVHDRDESDPAVMLTAHGSERIAVRAIKSGAYECVTKPFDIDEMSLVIDRALEARALRVQNRRLTAEKYRFAGSVNDATESRNRLRTDPLPTALVGLSTPDAQRRLRTPVSADSRPGTAAASSPENRQSRIRRPFASPEVTMPC